MVMTIQQMFAELKMGPANVEKPFGCRRGEKFVQPQLRGMKFCKRSIRDAGGTSGGMMVDIAPK